MPAVYTSRVCSNALSDGSSLLIGRHTHRDTIYLGILRATLGRCQAQLEWTAIKSEAI
jgi:hypothetical protein